MHASNGHIRILLDKEKQVVAEAEREQGEGFELIREDFSGYTRKKFITQYCQERIFMFYRYDARSQLIPKGAIIHGKSDETLAG